MALDPLSRKSAAIALSIFLLLPGFSGSLELAQQRPPVGRDFSALTHSDKLILIEAGYVFDKDATVRLGREGKALTPVELDQVLRNLWVPAPLVQGHGSPKRPITNDKRRQVIEELENGARELSQTTGDGGEQTGTPRQARNFSKPNRSARPAASSATPAAQAPAEALPLTRPPIQKDGPTGASSGPAATASREGGLSAPGRLLDMELTPPIAIEPPPPGSPHATPTPGRVGGIFIAQSELNLLIRKFLTTPVMRNPVIRLDPVHRQIVFQAMVALRTDYLRALGGDPNLGVIPFWATLELKTTPEGYVVVAFAENKNFIYTKKNGNFQWEVVKTELLENILDLLRPYLTVLSGDFAGFDRYRQATNKQIAELQAKLAKTPKGPAADDAQDELELTRLQLATIPILERQARRLTESFSSVLSYSGRKSLAGLEMDGNALVFRIKLNQLAPKIKDIELAGVRINDDRWGGSPEFYLTIDFKKSK